MVKRIFIISLVFAFVGCGSYTMSTFYVKNTSDKEVNFSAAVVKYSQMGPYLLNVPFTIKPKDSVLARKVKMRTDLSPENWFRKFEIFPTDGLEFNDPEESYNWVKTMGKNGNPIYTFKIIK